MSERILFGFFSETHCARHGSAYYSTLDGGEVEVTCVTEDPDGESYRWPDKMKRGRVRRYLRDGQRGGVARLEAGEK